MYEQLLELVVENETCLLKEYFHKFPKIYFKRLKLEVIEIFISKITKKPHLGYYWQNQYYLDIINYLSADFKGDIQKIISRVNNTPALVMLLNKKLKESGL